LRWDHDNRGHGCNEVMVLEGALINGADEGGVDFAWDRDGM